MVLGWVPAMSPVETERSIGGCPAMPPDMLPVKSGSSNELRSRTPKLLTVSRQPESTQIPPMTASGASRESGANTILEVISRPPILGAANQRDDAGVGNP